MQNALFKSKCYTNWVFVYPFEDSIPKVMPKPSKIFLRNQTCLIKQLAMQIFTQQLKIKQETYAILIDMNIFKIYHQTCAFLLHLMAHLKYCFSVIIFLVMPFCHYSLSYMSLRHILLFKVQKNLQFQQYSQPIIYNCIIYQ